ncbi:uncharacterized protein F5891DRAFT_985446 [Suillus fuscotomentosus]|uniref:BTB domain-containing protein n=1 Tax=Suillus fuscotomentosus TaxID=1912939 RepID=A0AAD4DTY8_9AGAM|nr:uncharacterized protein F5891DRAFT_985446 [Suillus fuscotomentosus]KAG1893903.1 hypothetical protein F5891DRAFT_985446 [Suillus fuscotomentosus]
MCHRAFGRETLYCRRWIIVHWRMTVPKGSTWWIEEITHCYCICKPNCRKWPLDPDDDQERQIHATTGHLVPYEVSLVCQCLLLLIQCVSHSWLSKGIVSFGLKMEILSFMLAIPYFVYIMVLVRHSPALEEILAIPSDYDTDGTEQLPIVLQQISEQEFTHFLNWVYHISVPPPPEEQFLVAILKISHLWMIRNSIKFAIDGLENLTLHSTRRLELARCSARSHSQCKEAWSGFWWKKVARAILHPTNPLPLTQTLQLILEAPLPNDMNAACRQATVDAMIELDGLEVEERIIEGVIRAVTLYFSSL